MVSDDTTSYLFVLVRIELRRLSRYSSRVQDQLYVRIYLTWRKAETISEKRRPVSSDEAYFKRIEIPYNGCSLQCLVKKLELTASKSFSNCYQI